MKKCIDCNKEIYKTSKRCSECYGKTVSKNKSIKWNEDLIRNCIDCNKQLENYYAKRCKSCAKKYQYSTRPGTHPMLGKKGKQGKDHPMFGKSPCWKRIQYKNIWMRSTWEVVYAKYLDKQGTKWLYEHKTFDLGNTTYTPDFYLPESDTYVEIKGWWRKESLIKFAKFKKIYSKINIIVIEKREFLTIKEALNESTNIKDFSKKK